MYISLITPVAKETQKSSIFYRYTMALKNHNFDNEGECGETMCRQVAVSAERTNDDWKVTLTAHTEFRSLEV